MHLHTCVFYAVIQVLVYVIRLPRMHVLSCGGAKATILMDYLQPGCVITTLASRDLDLLLYASVTRNLRAGVT